VQFAASNDAGAAQPLSASAMLAARAIPAAPFLMKVDMYLLDYVLGIPNYEQFRILLKSNDLAEMRDFESETSGNEIDTTR
jgi:hypothetical protein